jgi:hypothetical protein
MVEVQTSQVDAILVTVSLAQQWIKFGKHCWARQDHCGETMGLINGIHC